MADANCKSGDLVGVRLPDPSLKLEAPEVTLPSLGFGGSGSNPNLCNLLSLPSLGLNFSFPCINIPMPDVEYKANMPCSALDAAMQQQARADCPLNLDFLDGLDALKLAVCGIEIFSFDLPGLIASFSSPVMALPEAVKDEFLDVPPAISKEVDVMPSGLNQGGKLTSGFPLTSFKGSSGFSTMPIGSIDDWGVKTRKKLSVIQEILPRSDLLGFLKDEDAGTRLDLPEDANGNIDWENDETFTRLKVEYPELAEALLAARDKGQLTNVEIPLRFAAVVDGKFLCHRSNIDVEVDPLGAPTHYVVRVEACPVPGAVLPLTLRVPNGIEFEINGPDDVLEALESWTPRPLKPRAEALAETVVPVP